MGKTRLGFDWTDLPVLDRNPDGQIGIATPWPGIVAGAYFGNDGEFSLETRVGHDSVGWDRTQYLRNDRESIDGTTIETDQHTFSLQERFVTETNVRTIGGERVAGDGPEITAFHFVEQGTGTRIVLRNNLDGAGSYIDGTGSIVQYAAQWQDQDLELRGSGDDRIVRPADVLDHIMDFSESAGSDVTLNADVTTAEDEQGPHSVSVLVSEESDDPMAQTGGRTHLHYGRDGTYEVTRFSGAHEDKEPQLIDAGELQRPREGEDYDTDWSNQSSTKSNNTDFPKIQTLDESLLSTQANVGVDLGSPDTWTVSADNRESALHSDPSQNAPPFSGMGHDPHPGLGGARNVTMLADDDPHPGLGGSQSTPQTDDDDRESTAGNAAGGSAASATINSYAVAELSRQFETARHDRDREQVRGMARMGCCNQRYTARQQMTA